MAKSPEEKAREKIDGQLRAAGWVIQDRDDADVSAARGVAIREFPLVGGDEADYLLYVDGKAIGTVEAKPEGTTLTGVETQSSGYVDRLPANLPAYRRPLPFSYESTGVETRFTNRLDPNYRSREVFTFHRPDTLLERVQQPAQIRDRLRQMPALSPGALWAVQQQAIANLERSFAQGRPRALIQMSTGSGKTFTAVNFTYRLIKHADARRVLFLVDRGNLGRQTLTEFQQFVTPDDGRKFTELYNVQHLQGGTIDRVSRVCISTIQRLYAILRGEELDPELEEGSFFQQSPFQKQPPPVEYNPLVPIETFDFIVTDECHRSIYNLWRQVLEYFDASIIGLTATPSAQTIGFFDRNLVMQYTHDQAVADGVNVNFDVYRIRTRISEQGSAVERGYYVDKRDRETRAKRWEQLDEDLIYDAKVLDRDVVSPDQIRTVIRAFKDALFTELFPGRTHVPKTLIFAKDDSHADDIVQIVREEFDKGNEFAQKITYRTTGKKPEDLIAEFRRSYFPRIAVTVDMIATGTDIKPLEVVFFMRSVKSRLFFEQMKGRGVRVINATDFQAVTPDGTKDHFVIVDAVGVCEACKTDTQSLERKRHVSFEKLLETIAFGSTDEDVISSVAGRLARLDQRLSDEQRSQIAEVTGGQSLTDVVNGLVAALDADTQVAQAKTQFSTEQPTDEQVQQAAQQMLAAAAQPLRKARVRSTLVDIKRSFEQTIDTVSQDEILEAGFSAAARDKAQSKLADFRKWLDDNKDRITALQVLYSVPYQRRLTYAEIKELAEAISKPPLGLTTSRLWQAYQALEQSKVRGGGGQQLTDIISVVRFALQQDAELRPFAEGVSERFARWMAAQQAAGRRFSPEQVRWLERMRDHIAASLSITPEDFEYTPFNEDGGLGKAMQLFGADFRKLLDELNEELAA
ncbi:MAG: DEAD/DEAH box helicase family protein [Planctomycetes bacterium]|nr:DEAD/DEAH box helicase family protein [Planctomycetota bacterium]